VTCVAWNGGLDAFGRKGGVQRGRELNRGRERVDHMAMRAE
jgi:hypothetical protein